MCKGNSHASNPSWWDLSFAEVRNKINKRIMDIEAATPPVYSVVDRSIKREGRKTAIRIYTPTQGEKFPVVLLIHGGAWVAGNLDTHDNLARYLSSESKAVVVSVGYQNAPEGKFPLALDQCYDTLKWIGEHGIEIAADINRVAVVGDSAGGNIAAALCLMNRDRFGPKINIQVLINPAPDLTCKGTIEKQNDSLDTLRWQATQYLLGPKDANNPYASPLVAKNLEGLPPAVIILAEQDDLRESGQKYADRLEAAGIPTYVYCQLGVNHLAGHAAKASNLARESLEVAVEQNQNAFLSDDATEIY
ncbi:MAG: alpha/beta hydrolase [Chlamydiota bacterium]|nr:alpha/beta hydrolase [Chlamydiota bacterium]